MSTSVSPWGWAKIGDPELVAILTCLSQGWTADQLAWEGYGRNKYFIANKLRNMRRWTDSLTTTHLVANALRQGVIR